MSMVLISVFKAVDASLPMKWNPGLIPQIFKSVANSVRSRIISLSHILFIAVVSMVLQSYTYMNYMYLFPLLDVIGKCPHILE